MVALNRTTVEKEAGPRDGVSPGLVTLMLLLEAPLRLTEHGLTLSCRCPL